MKALVVCALALAAGCTKSVATADKDYFGKIVAPPRGLARVQPGMTKPEALAAGVKELRPGVYGVPSGVRDVDLLVTFDDRPAPRVQSVVAWVRGPAAAHLREWLRDAWGTPAVDDDHGQLWQGDAWRALVSEGPQNTEEIQLWPAVTEAFWGHTPGALPAPLAKVRYGMTKPEIDALVPRAILVDGSAVAFEGSERPEGLTRISVLLDVDHALPSLRAAWGDGKLVEGRHLYDDPVSGWRATLRPGVNTMLEWEPLAPLATLLGDGPELAAIMPWKYDDPTAPAATWLPVTELTEQDVVRFSLVDTANVHLKYLDAASRDALSAAFAAKWGAPAKADGGVLVYHRDAPYVIARDNGHEWQLAVRRSPPPPGSKAADYIVE